MTPTTCTCPHIATAAGFIRNGRDAKCAIHGDAPPVSTLFDPAEPLPDGVIQEMLTNVRTINRLHINDKRWDQTINRDRHGKTIYDYMQEVLEETQRQRRIVALSVAAKDPSNGG